MLVIFQKGNKVTNKAFAALVTTIKLTNETIARIENVLENTKIEIATSRLNSGLLLLPFQTK